MSGISNLTSNEKGELMEQVKQQIAVATAQELLTVGVFYRIFYSLRIIIRILKHWNKVYIFIIVYLFICFWFPLSRKWQKNALKSASINPACNWTPPNRFTFPYNLINFVIFSLFILFIRYCYCIFVILRYFRNVFQCAWIGLWILGIWFHVLMAIDYNVNRIKCRKFNFTNILHTSISYWLTKFQQNTSIIIVKYFDSINFNCYYVWEMGDGFYSDQFSFYEI